MDLQDPPDPLWAIWLAGYIAAVTGKGDSETWITYAKDRTARIARGEPTEQ